MRIAILSDLHGNLIALEATLEDVSNERIDQIVILGDVILNGPQPRETLARVRQLGAPVVMGNTDAWLLTTHPAPDEAERTRLSEIEAWSAEQVTPEDLDYIRTFQPTIEIPLGNGERLLCFHGSPRSRTEVIHATTPDEEVMPMLGGCWAEVMAGGHTHVQMLRRLRDGILLNPGSVGLPVVRGATPEQMRRPTWAEYAILTADPARGLVGIELRRAPFDTAQVARIALESGMPYAAWWAAGWKA